MTAKLARQIGQATENMQILIHQGAGTQALAAQERIISRLRDRARNA